MPDGAAFRIQARALGGRGCSSLVQTLSAAGNEAFSPRVAVNAAGQAFADWTFYDSSGYAGVQAARDP